jgi:uncharacterized protein
LFEALRFFDHHLRGTPDPLSDERRFYYTTLGESGWKSTATWPPAGFSVANYYLNSAQTLGPKQGGAAIPVKLDLTSTGQRNRWHTQLTGNNVVYTDVLPMMQSLPAFTGSPLNQSVEITGQPVLRLRLRPMREDPSLLVYLVVIDSHNQPIYLSEGHLRLVHRKLDTSEATLHTYMRRDASPVKSEEEIEAAMTLLPLSALVPKGSRLRLLLAAADDADFPGMPYSAVIVGHWLRSISWSNPVKRFLPWRAVSEESFELRSGACRLFKWGKSNSEIFQLFCLKRAKVSPRAGIAWLS